MALLLFSVALLEHRRTRPTAPVGVACGFLAGLAVYGYFIYIFLVPVAAVYMLWCWRGERNRRTLIICWVLGLALGGSPYLLASLLILKATGGVHGFLNFLVASLAGLAVADSPMSLVQRAQYFVNMVNWTMLDVGPATMMLGKALPLSFPTTKLAVLLGVPALGLAINLFRAPRSQGIFLAAGFFLGSAVLTAVFGGRLWLHHFALLLPVAYIAVALALQRIAFCFAMRRTDLLAPILSIVVIVPLMIGNAIDRLAVLSDLTRTGGVGLASDAIERFANENFVNNSPTWAFFPDWGIFMPFEMVTRGRIPLTTGFTPEDARRMLCAGNDVLLAIMIKPQSDRLPDWIREVGWGQPDVSTYAQRDGVPVLTAVRWHASTPGHSACPA
nr:hypothetical protein [uncultured Rhodopila sp.]